MEDRMIEEKMAERLHERFGRMLDKEAFGYRYAAREVPVGKAGRLDVVGYCKVEKVFKVVECKAGSGKATIWKAFGQMAMYRAAIENDVLGFLDAFTRKSPMRFERMMEATSGGKRIAIEFYVALTDEACKDWDCLIQLKELNPDTGIFRIKDDLRVRDNVKDPNGNPNHELAKARRVSLAFTWPTCSGAIDKGMPALAPAEKTDPRTLLRQEA